MSALDIFQHDGEFVVTSETIAIGAGVEHRAVLQLIATNMADFEDFGRVAFEMRPFETPGGTQHRRVALLNEQQATLLMTFQRNTEQVRAFKKALVKAFFEMAHQVQPLTEEQIVAQALQITTRKVEALEARIAEDRPKVEYVETFVAPEDLRILRAVASSINVPEGALRQALIDHKWIYEEVMERWSNTLGRKEKVRRYSPHADKKPYFRTVANHDAPRFKGEVMHTLKVTPQGAIAIARAAARWGLADSEVAA